jgi:hypothetical protein
MVVNKKPLNTEPTPEPEENDEILAILSADELDGERETR